MFCNCLLGGGWKAMCFVTVCWVVAGKPGMKKKNVVFVCCFFGSAKDSTLRSPVGPETMSAPEPWKQGQGGGGWSSEEWESWYRQRVPDGSSAGEWKNGGGEGEERKKGEEAAEEERQKACS